MINNDLTKLGLSRRELLSTAAAATGALVVGFWMPQPAPAQVASPAGATWATEPAVEEINAWVVVAPDDTVTIRIAQTELGQGVWTSNAMMVCEELQCDWSKVRPQYASVNRDGQEMAPEWTLDVMGKGATDPFGGGEPEFGDRSRTGITGIPNSLYRRMRTNAAASVKDGRYYLQLAGAEARERLLLAAAKSWGVPVEEVSSGNSVITHRLTTAMLADHIYVVLNGRVVESGDHDELSLNGGLVYLSDHYVAATTAAQRAAFATAAEGLIAVSNAVNAAGILTAIGMLILSLVMLKGVFHKGVAYLGIVTGALGIVSEAFRDILGPGYYVYGLLLPIWFLAVGWKLYRLG